MPTAGLWCWLPAMTVMVCWGLLVLAWLTGAIYNARRAPAVRERSVYPWPRLIGLAALLVFARVPLLIPRMRVARR
jgi:hypothetical protein